MIARSGGNGSDQSRLDNGQMDLPCVHGDALSR